MNLILQKMTKFNKYLININIFNIFNKKSQKVKKSF